jgi:class 3 adenylate cyclase
VQESVGRQVDVVGPAVNVAHRLLKNTVRDVIGYRPYVLVSAPAARALDIADAGIDHEETYADVGVIDTRIIDLAELAQP